MVVSERTRALASGLFEYADLGLHPLKGVYEPLHLFQVVGTRVSASRFEATRSEGALTPLVGREEEIALLLRRWQEAKDGEGKVVLVGGEPGIGKSRLTRVLRERLGQEQYLVLRYQCSPYHVNSALYPIIEQFERAAGFTREDTPEQKLNKLEVVLVGSDDQVAEMAPLFAGMLSLPVERYPPLNFSPQQQKDKTLEALASQVEALAQRQPVLMIYEDVHWIDATTQEALDLLVPRLQNLPILLIVTYRPEYSPRWSEHAHVTLLGLSRLGRRQGAELVAKVTGGSALPADVLEQIVAHTDGVPLFVEELTKSILESKLLREQDNRYVLDGPLPALAIPTTLRDSLIARLDRLAPVREIAQIGACIGREFTYDLLAGVSPLKGAKLDDALEQLTRTGLVFRRGTPPGATYTFKHALVQDAAYDSLLKSKRAQVHGQIAHAVLQSSPATARAELLARHFNEAGLYEKAAFYGLQAGKESLARSAFTEAANQLRSALRANEALPEAPAGLRQALEIRLALSSAMLPAKGWAAGEIVEVLGPARHLALALGDWQALICTLLHLGSHYGSRCELPQALESIESLDKLAQSKGIESALVVARVFETWIRLLLGEYEAANQNAERAHAHYHHDRDAQFINVYGHDLLCWTNVFWSEVLWALGWPDRALQVALQQRDRAMNLAHPWNLYWSLTGGSRALLYRGQTREMAAWIDAARKLAREQAMGHARSVELFWGSFALIENEQWAEGLSQAQEAVQMWREAGGRAELPLAYCLIAKCLAAMQRTGDAISIITDTIALVEQLNDRQYEVELYRTYANVLVQGNREAEAEKNFVKALEIARTRNAKSWELRAATSYARLMKDQARHKEALQLLQPIYEWFTEGRSTKDHVEAKALLDELRA